ncbi:hypothetical protein [Azoarcus sp. L1K30]|uniref:hypothetical protein n=1 Tax=Azoarcus sp. L1K30 TaxID=2820277 RepID=UPI002012429F|nr:hypothetical protein [Azoarcus sp. L1K30]
MFVKRDESGRIVAASLEIRGDVCEPVEEGAPELLAFGRGDSSEATLTASDLRLVRVLEDIVDLLIERDVIRFTDLPEQAQEKLMERRSLRASMRRGLDLLGAADDDGLI